MRARSIAARIHPPWVLAGLVAVSAGLRFWGASRIPSPWITPDEQTYAELGRSLWSSGRFEILGAATEPLTLVHPALIGLPLAALDPEAGYLAAKAVQAVVMSLAAVPVYLWGRSLMSRGWALVAAALTLAVPGLAYTGFLMTEVSFYPVLVLAAWAAASALASPTLERQALALGTMLLASATRLQAVVLVPAFLLALGLELWFRRGSPREALRFAPLVAGIAGVAAIWSALVLDEGDPASGLLGTYGAAAEVSYEAGEAAKFAVYHVADLLLMTAVLPVVALALLMVRAASGRDESARVRAFLAVTTALAVGFAAQVGLFASRNLERLGERYLLGLAPLLFLALALWLDRGAPRPRLATAAASAGALGLLAALPLPRVVTEAAAPDALSTIPLHELARLGSLGVGPELELVVLLAAAAMLALLALVPRRLAWLLPAIAFALLAAGSASATRFVERQARVYTRTMIGGDKRWIDRFAAGPVLFLYAGEHAWSGGGPVWTNLFWNRRIERVATLRGPLYGPVPRVEVSIAPDGRLEGLDAGPTPVAAVGNQYDLVGTRVTDGGSYALWLLDPPTRVSSRLEGVLSGGEVAGRAALRVYGCRGAAVAVRLSAAERAAVELSRDGVAFSEVELAAGESWEGRVPLTGGAPSCTVALAATSGRPRVERFEVVRRAAP